ncbi:putative RNA helicase [Helianthus annuus]|nr:putative RNA helicase [Helianthus annuus]
MLLLIVPLRKPKMFHCIEPVYTDSEITSIASYIRTGKFKVVINYDFLTDVEDYVHRIRRTGKAVVKGAAYTFISEQDWKHAADLNKFLGKANQPMPHEAQKIARRDDPVDSGQMCGHWDCGGRHGFGVMKDDGSRGCGVDARDVGFGGSGGPGRGDMWGGKFGGRDDCLGGHG